MRQGSVMPTIMVGILTIGILFYFVFAFWESLTDTYTSTITYTYDMPDSVKADGILLREEHVLPLATGLFDVLRREGEQVGVGQIVGREYRDASSMQEQSQLETKIEEAEILEYALGDKVDVVTVTKMDEDIVSALSTLRSAVTTGNYNQLESQIASVKGNILRRDYIFGSPLVAKSLQDRYQYLVFENQTLAQNTVGSVSNITTPVSGSFSILVDGLEHLSADLVMDYSVTEFYDLIKQGAPVATEGTGKIITNDVWHFLAVVPWENASEMRVGTAVTVRFSGDFTQDITMTVEEVGEEDGDSALVLLSTNRFLEQTTLLRIQSAELVYESHSGLRIPKEAMRMVTYTNSETGETRDEYGVYVVSAGYAEFKPAVILAEGNDFYVVQAKSNASDALKAGNEVIVNAVGLYDGKLLEY